MVITLKDGRTLMGTPLQIVKQMKGLEFNGGGSVSEYIDRVAERLGRLDDVELQIAGETDEARALSLVDEMLRTGIARREDS